MKNYAILAAILLVFVSTGQADQSADDPDSASLRTIDIDQLQELDGLMHEHGSREPFTGKAVSYHDRQKDHLEAEIDIVSGKPHGYATEYYTDGSKKSETKLVDGEEMYTITWHRNGQKESEKTWVDGKYIATTFWYESGEKAETHYYPGSPEFAQKRQEVDSGDPVKPGSKVYNYKVKGYEFYYVSWYKNGQKKIETVTLDVYDQRTKMHKTPPHGLRVTWFEDGGKGSEAIYSYGLLKSKTWWRANGQKKCEAFRNSLDETLQRKAWDTDGKEIEPTPSEAASKQTPKLITLMCPIQKHAKGY